MKRHRFSIFCVLMLSLMLLLACDRSMSSLKPATERVPSEAEQPPSLTITASILPQTYFVKRIGKERVSVQAMVEPGANPATYEPKPEQLKALQASAAYMRIGVPFEETWMERIRGANPDMRIVDTTQSIERLPMDSTHTHDEGEVEKQEAVSAENLDPHIWLSPRLVKVQAQTIAQALGELDPENRSFYRANLEDFLTDVDELDAYIRERLQNLENRKFMVFHPSWGYFARDYDLEMIPVEVGGQEPSAKELAALIEEAQEENIRVVFAQPEFSVRSAEAIAQEIDGEVRLISPLDPEWEENLRRVADTFAQVLGE